MFSSCLGKSIIWAFLKWKSGDGLSCRTSFSDWAVPLPAESPPDASRPGHTRILSVPQLLLEAWIASLDLSVLPCLHLLIARCHSIPCHSLQVCLGRGGHMSLLPLSMTALAQVLGCSSLGCWKPLLAGLHGRSHSYHGSLLCLPNHDSGRALRGIEPCCAFPWGSGADEATLTFFLPSSSCSSWRSRMETSLPSDLPRMCG